MIKENRQAFSGLVVLAIALVTSACSSPKYALHSVYKLTGCGKQLGRDVVAESLVRRGYLLSAERKGPYDIFHKPNIVKKGRLAQEPFEDRAGDLAVAVCAGGSENYIVTEEWRSCEGSNADKNCTAVNQRELREIAESWACQVSEKSERSKSWKLEDRQDWNKESCSLIVSSLL